MSYVIYNLRTLRLYKGNSYGPKHYELERTAKAQFTKLTTGLKPKLVACDWKVLSYDEYKTLNTMVTVNSIMTGSPVRIDVNDVGGVCDPSMESYWSM